MLRRTLGLLLPAILAADETRIGAISTAAGVLVATAAARLLRVGRFADLAAAQQGVHAAVTRERA